MTLRRHISAELCRLRHRRGHGIHSPLVYALKREVFMKRHPAGGELYDVLLRNGIKRKYAREINGLYTHLGAEGFHLEDGSLRFSGPAPCMLSFGPRSAPAREALSIDRRGYMIFFDDPSFPKQHFIV